MRFTPAAILLASALALSASSTMGKKTPDAGVSAAAKPWADHGARALDAGDLEAARNAYETALLLSPGDPRIYFALGRIARAQKMPGRAIKYFADVRRLDPDNQTALLQEGLAMMDKGAIESARQTLAELQALCKANCAITEPLVSAIAAGPPKYMTAEANTAAKASPIDN